MKFESKAVALLVATFIVFCIPELRAQNAVDGKILVHDTVRLEVIRLFPDSFPNVSVIFKASGPGGEAIYNLDSSSVHVFENDSPCKIISVKRISNDWAVNTALVVDHSGSMRMDDRLRKYWDSLPSSAWKLKRKTIREQTSGEVDSDSMIMVREAPADPTWYHTPLWYAQRAATTYVRKTDPRKDKNCLIGFSTDVDVSYSLNTSQDGIVSGINTLYPNGETAFYDAVSRAIDEADKGDGIRVVIAMTDGNDNNSRESLRAVIDKARQKRIPVYVIGLGDVDQTSLKRLARQTGGLAYFTNDASTLSEIYRRITLEIQSIYEVVYTSPSMSLADTTRDCQLYFEVDNKYLSSRSLPYVIPAEVVARIKAKEEAITAQALPVDPTEPVAEPEIPWGLIGIGVTILGAGVLSARYLKKKTREEQLQIVNLYPNPVVGPLTVVLNTDITSMPGQVLITDAKGQIVFTEEFTTGSAKDLNVSHLENGTYTLSVQAAGNLSSSKMFVVSK